MVKEKKIFHDLIEKVSDVKATSKEGRYRIAFLRDGIWYGFLESEIVCNDTKEQADKAIKNRHKVKFEYTIDGEWYNVAKIISWYDPSSDKKEPAKKEKSKPAAPAEEKVETTRKVTMMVGLAKTINLGEYSTVRPEFRIEETIEGTLEDIELLKDEWLEKFRLWIEAEEANHR